MVRLCTKIYSKDLQLDFGRILGLAFAVIQLNKVDLFEDYRNCSLGMVAYRWGMVAYRWGKADVLAIPSMQMVLRKMQWAMELLE